MVKSNLIQLYKEKTSLKTIMDNGKAEPDSAILREDIFTITSKDHYGPW